MSLMKFLFGALMGAVETAFIKMNPFRVPDDEEADQVKLEEESE